MTVVATDPVPSGPAVANDTLLAGSRKREIEAPLDRVRRDGKFFRLGEDKFCVKGVTYGSFRSTPDNGPVQDARRNPPRLRADPRAEREHDPHLPRPAAVVPRSRRVDGA